MAESDPNKKRRRVTVEIDDKSFTDLRRLLFAHGIKIGEFFNCIVQKASTNEEVILKMIKDTIDHKHDKINIGQLAKGVDARTLYQMIEEQNKKKSK